MGCVALPRITVYPGVPDPSIKNYQVRLFLNEAVSGPPNLAVDFTEALRDFLQRNTTLAQVSNNPSLEFSGTIEKYEVNPIAPTGSVQDQTAQLQRLTIGIKVQFINNSDPTKNFDKVISNFAEFDADQTLADVEGDLIPEIFNNIIQEIFNQSIATW